MMALNKATLCWPNQFSRCTVTSDATWSLPLSRLSTRVLKERARTSAEAFWINLALDRPRSLGCIALLSHNLSVTATWRVRLYDAGDAVLEDTGFIDVWPSVFSQQELNWEDVNYWTSKPTDEDRARFTPMVTHFASRRWVPSRVRIDVVDIDNPDGYIELGRVFVADLFQPSVNIDYGAQWGMADPTEIESALDGTEYYDERPQRRSVSVVFSNLDQDEAFARLYRMRRDVGISGEVLFAYQLKLDGRFLQRTLFGRLSQADALTHPNALRYAHAVQIVETL